ncbi:MAG: CGGC domain-containing protein [Thermodesulfobacteriota bacterium]|nr:CGGC domain-containing protein [Thermodesulfobacteriota bacterium]
MSSKIVILSCKKIRDISCVSCIKCFKGVKEKNGEFAKHGGEIEVIAMGDCGDCPGLVMPKLALIKDVCQQYGADFDTVHLGTCMVKASQTAACPIDIDALKTKLEGAFGKKVIVGTHAY